MTDRECIEQLEFWLEHLDSRIAQLPGHEYSLIQEVKPCYALARAALIVLRAEVEKDTPS